MTSRSFSKITDGHIIESGKLSRDELIHLLTECPSVGPDEAEINSWNDAYFATHHAPKKLYSLPSSSSRKFACHKISQVFSGQNAVYPDILSDMKICILAMRSPDNIHRMLFQDIMEDASTSSENSQNDGTQSLKPIEPAIPGYNPPSEIKSADEGAGPALLAEDIGESVNPYEGAAKPSSEAANSDIREFWGYITESLSKIENKCFGALTALSPVLSSHNGQVMELVTMLLCKAIMLNADKSPSQGERGLLYGACVTHISMHGLAPPKYLEQAAAVMGKGIGDFASEICSTMVEQSIIDYIRLFKASVIPDPNLNILGQRIDAKFQTTWRFCRLYNPAHFNRFKTSLNAPLILRCAAFISYKTDGQTMDQMILLQNSANREIYNHEMARTRKYLEKLRLEQDKGITEQSKAFIGAMDADETVSYGPDD